MPASIRVEGLRETVKSLEALGADRKSIGDAGFESAKILIQTALPLVPVRTGRLRGTLKPGRDGRTGAGIARAGSSAVPYANPIHWGWAIVGVKHKGKLASGGPRRFRNIKPNPFYSIALGYTYQEIIDNYNKLMQAMVDKHLGKGN